MKANHAIEHDITGPCAQVNIEKDFLVEIFSYESTSDSKHIVSSHKFLQEHCTDGVLYRDSWRALCMLIILVYARD